MSDEETAPRETRTYTLGRKRERNFIGKLPRRTAIAIGVTFGVFVLSMMFQQVKFALFAAVVGAVITGLVHFQNDGRSLPTSVKLSIESWWRGYTGEAQYLSGPESKVPGGQRCAPGLLSPTTTTSDVDANGYPFGVIVNLLERTATVKITGELTGDVLRSEDEADHTTAQWGRAKAQWAHHTHLLWVVGRVGSRPSTGRAAIREVDTLVSQSAPEQARAIQYERARLLHFGGQDGLFELAFTFKVQMNHDKDYSFLEQMRYDILSLYSGALPWSGVEQAKPMAEEEMIASTHMMFNPASESDFEQLRVGGESHGMAWEDAGPTVADMSSDRRWYFHDGVWSRVWEMVGAPPSTFEDRHLAPLLRHHSRIIRKNVVMVYRPFSPGDAHNLVDEEHRDAMVGVNDGKNIKSVDAELRLETTDASRKALAKGAGYGRDSMYIMATTLPGEDTRAIETDMKALGDQVNIRVRDFDGRHDSAIQFCMADGALPFKTSGLGRN